MIAKVVLREDIKNRIKNGHPWIYDTEIECIEGGFENGDIVDVFYHSHDFLGKGYINTNSRIRVRLLTRKNEKIDKRFFVKRIKEALEVRKPLVENTEAFRAIFSESDGLPGLVVDKYGNYLVIQIGTLGMEKLKTHVIDALIEIFDPKGIYEKSDYSGREKEGLGKSRGWVYGSGPELIKFRMNDLVFFADTLGQKTGFFLDQRENAKLLKGVVEGKAVLDVFSYTGAFSVHALYYGAKHVVLVDYSGRALEIAKLTLKENGFDGRFQLVNENAFDYLRKLYRDGIRDFDVIILDPPAFAKSYEDRRSAYRGYKEINLRSMKMLRKGGYLVTSSCSRVVSEQDFLVVLYDAANDSKVRLKMLKKGGQPPDHPPLLNVFETFYLKFFIFQVEDLKV